MWHMIRNDRVKKKENYHSLMHSLNIIPDLGIKIIIYFNHIKIESAESTKILVPIK